MNNGVEAQGCLISSPKTTRRVCMAVFAYVDAFQFRLRHMRSITGNPPLHQLSCAHTPIYSLNLSGHILHILFPFDIGKTIWRHLLCGLYVGEGIGEGEVW